MSTTSSDLAAAFAALLAAAQTAPAEQPSEVPTLLNVEEAAEMLRCSKTLLYTMLGDGRLPSVKVGRRRLVRAADVAQFVARGGAVA
ncbi:MAG: helix-turn-helix domain-containing protein [Actinomycetia bacterium]|nr:helix-turn-helix domain-containing protein [Actinomycetes bacterium]